MDSKGLERIDTDNLDKLFSIKKDQFHKDLREMKRLIKIWRNNELQVKADNSQKAILIQYCAYLEQTNNIDTLKGPTFVKHISYKQDLKDVKKESDIFLGVGLLQQKEWKLNFNKKFIKKVKCLSEQLIMDIFLKFRLFTEGFIDFGKGKFNSLEEYPRINRFGMKYYTHRLDIDNDIYFMLISIGLNQIPSYQFNGGELQSFSYAQVITCEDIIHSTVFYCQKKMIDFIELLEGQYEEDPRMSYLKEDLIHKKEPKSQNNNSKKKAKKQLTQKIYPKKYQKKIISMPNNNQICLEVENFQFLMKKYLDYEIRSEYLQSLQPINTNSIDQLRKQTAKNSKIQFKDHAHIVESLEKIPNFKFLLTKQQRQILCKNGNVIIVGRSGTGKTTCAILRLYGVEISIKYAEYNTLKIKKIQAQNEKQCKMIILEKIHLAKNIFLTFSGILIDQIKKQYDDMLYQIKEKHSKKCTICEKTLRAKNDEKQNEDPIDKLKRLQQQQEKKVVSLNLISLQDFPGFFTIENFVRIIDKTINRPFFSQQKQMNNQKMAQIKQALINHYEYCSNDIILSQTVKAVYVDYNFFLHHIWEKLPRQLIKSSKQYCLLTPSIVWSQIFSILKGSVKSYLCPGGYISLKMYIQNTQSIFQIQLQKMEQYKKKAYKILKSYIQWCRHEKAYDLMDVVSHNLRQIQSYGYSGPKINYMFVDEVQDLTASTILLISKMVINNIFYCGDTAQAITKGVSFRFQDLKLIFNHKYFKYALNIQPPSDIQNLTVNFRSHNCILQLANSIVSSLQILFPNSINKLKKQKSDLIGPKPFLILNQSQSMIFQLICGSVEQNKLDRDIDLRQIVYQSQSKNTKKLPSRKKDRRKKRKKQQELDQLQQNEKDPRKFNNQQVIIVRNAQQQQKLPLSLKKGIVLTPQKAKGLQYDQIILYNFFGSCPIYDKWNYLLQHIQCIQDYEDQKEFQENLSRRNQQQKNKEQPLTVQTKILLGYDPQKRKYKSWSMKAKQSIKGVLINTYHQIATELKILYTAITRARSVFIIFDTRIPKNFVKLWQKMNLVTVINDQNVEFHHKTIYEYVKINQKHIKYINQNKHWFRAGCEMLARKDYENAKKCYKNIERIDLVERIQALQQEIKAERQLYRIKSQLQKVSNLSKDERKIVKARLQKQKKEAFKIYINAGKIYQKNNRYNDAAEVYFKIQNYQLALKFYQLSTNIDNSKQIAICCKHLKRYKDALDSFKQLQDIQGIIECYIELKQWQLLFNQFCSHPQYINKYKEHNISINCIKNVLNQTIKKRRHLPLLQQQKRLYKTQQFQNQINKIIKESDCLYVNSIWQRLVMQSIKYKEIEKTHHFFARQNDKLKAQHKSKQQAKDTLIYELKLMSDQIQILTSNLQRYKQYLPAQLKSNKQYQDYKIRLKIKQIEKPQLQIEKKKISQEILGIEENMSNNKAVMNKLIDQLNDLDQKYDYKNIKKDIVFIQEQFKTKKQQLSKIKSSKDQIPVGQNNRIEESKQLIAQIKRVLTASQKFIKYQNQKQYPSFHHKFIQQKLFRNLSDCQGIFLLKKCNFIGDNITCFQLCQVYNKLIALSPKYILGHLLESSNNFKQNRSFKNQIYQTQQANNILNMDMNNQNEVGKFIQKLSNQNLQHNIPKISFENTFYYEPIVSSLTFGLILQGYIKQVLIFLQLNVAWKLAYIFSIDQSMANIIKKMSTQFGQLKFKNQEFFFIQDEFLLWKFSEARMLNIFSVQKLFYMYDQCQNQQFLSKKKVSVEFEIQQEVVTQFYNEDSIKRIEKMKKQKKEIQQKIQLKLKQLSQAEQNKKTAEQQLIIIQANNNMLRKDRRQTINKLQRQQQIQRQLKKQLTIAKMQLDKATMSTKQKLKYELDIKQQELSSSKNNSKLYQSKDLFQLKNQYRFKIQQQKQAYDIYQKTQKDINQIEIVIKSLQIKNQKIKQTININQSKLFLFPQQQLNYQQFFDQKNSEIKKLRGMISKDLDIENQQQLIELIVKRLIKEQQLCRHQRYMHKLRQQNMDKILFESNIPNTHNYSFVRLYMKGKSIKNYDSIDYKCQIYYKILYDSYRLEKIQNEGTLIELSNVVMLYLSYIFKKTFREDTDNIVQMMIEEMEGQYQNKCLIHNSIVNLQNKIQYFNKYANQSPYLIQQKHQTQLQIMQFVQILNQPPKYTINPKQLLNHFISTIFQRIQAINSSHDIFLHLLFGFFQCRIIKQCQPLDFISNQYVIIRNNSVILQRLKENTFAYYFDQQNRNILCRFEDVCPAIISYIVQKHLILSNNNADYEENQLIQKIRNRFINTDFMGYSKNNQNIEQAILIKLNQFTNQPEKQQIKQLYFKLFVDSYQIITEIRSQRRKQLQYFLCNRLQNPQFYHYFNFQLRQYYFVQKMLVNMKSYNYDLLKAIKKKMEMLQLECNKFMQRNFIK